jgi:tetratricopeptide (TPR) repeat protein
LIYNVLLQQPNNYKKENIIVLYNFDGHSYLLGDDLDDPNETSVDIDGPATFANIQSVISDLVLSLTRGDQLAVFFTGVPVNLALAEPRFGFYIDEYNIQLYPISDFSEPMEEIGCGQMILTFDVNSSDDVLEYFEAANGTDVKCLNRYLHGSTRHEEENLSEMHLSGGEYSEQLFYWASATRGYLPDYVNHSPWITINIHVGSDFDDFPYEEIIEEHPGDNKLDDNEDGFIQMGEAFNYADNMNTWSNDGYCYLPYNQGIIETPIQTDEIPFVEDLLTLAGLSGKIENSQNIPFGSYIISDFLEISTNVVINFQEYSKIFINKNDANPANPTWFSFGPLSEVHFGEYCEFNTNLQVTENYADIIGHGSLLDIGHFSNFHNIHISLGNYNQVSIGDGEFTSSSLVTENMLLTIQNCTFNSSLLSINGGEASVLSSDFSYSQLFPSNCDEVVIQDCSFNFNFSLPNNNAIKLHDAGSYLIRDNIFSQVSGYNGSAIYVQFSGWEGNNCGIIDNNISNCNNGITLFNSRSYLSGNQIFDNIRGIQVLNNSDVNIIGNSEAKFVNETQRCNDNEEYEIFTDYGSFPYLRWNAIYDEDNLGINDELIYCQLPLYTELDIRYNFFGNEFKDVDDLFPDNSYYYNPIFKLEFSEEEKSDAQVMFETAKEKSNTGYYSEADSIFKVIIQLYPETQFAQLSVKELYSLQGQFTENFSALKQYYDSDPTIINDTLLSYIGNYFSNKCDIKLENWIDAIAWFEDKILNPISFADSIYSIIDLQNTYLLMEQSSFKSSNYVGTMPKYRPESQISHSKYTNYLLSLLPGNDKLCETMKENINALMPGKLMQNVPNPFNGGTEIWYKLDEDASVEMNVYDYTGRKIDCMKVGWMEDGSHSIHFESKDLPSGIYFCTLEVDGKMSDSKKMTILR